MMAAMLLGSCRGDEGPMGPPGAPGANGMDGKDGLETHRTDLTIESKDWILDEKDNYFYYVFNGCDEITPLICDKGSVNAYAMMEDDGVEYQTQLPMIRYKYYIDNKGEMVPYQTMLDYEYAPGKITFFVTNSDFNVESKPDSYKIRLILHW